MWYVIYSRDVANSLPLRQSVRPQHLARCQELIEQGRLMVGGPRPAIDAEDPGEAGFQGSLIIARFDSLEAARQWADSDPYVAAGVYETVEVSPFRQVLP